METLLLITPWLAVLACPLMMLLMMRMMPGGSCDRKPQVAQGSDETSDQIRQLQARIAELEANRETTEIAR